MATSTELNEETLALPDTTKAPGVPLVPLVLAVLAAAMLTVAVAGGALYWMARSGRLGSFGGAKEAAPVTPMVKAEPKTHPVVLEPLLVNLADAGGGAFLRISMTMQVLDDEPVKGEKPKEEKPEKGKVVVNEFEAPVRDTALAVIGRMTAPSLLEADGKEKLKQQLLAAVQQRVPKMKVKEIFFTELLVQQ